MRFYPISKAPHDGTFIVVTDDGTHVANVKWIPADVDGWFTADGKEINWTPQWFCYAHFDFVPEGDGVTVGADLVTHSAIATKEYPGRNKRMNRTKWLIIQACYWYYVMCEPMLEDHTFDLMLDELRSLERRFGGPDPDSPTQIIYGDQASQYPEFVKTKTLMTEILLQDWVNK